ncbi:MAG: hypothetical protein AAFZ15_20210 [Bacteroidota bacterium]
MKKLIIFSFLLAFMGCSDLVDFTEVENPNLSEASVVGQLNSSTIWLSGIERQLSLLINEIVINAEIASDNYTNDQTFFNQFLDGLSIIAQDDDIADLQFDLHRLREMAVFGKVEVGPNDENYSTDTEAEYNYFEGLAYMYAGMYFTGLPAEAGGAPLTDAANYAQAITLFDAAIALNPLPEYYAAKARVHYLLGNKAEAVAAATAATDASADFLRAATFDEQEDPDNVMEDALYERGTFDDLQPLPTLDFLDPKYSFNTAQEDDPVYYMKAEEAWLIQIEAAIVDGDFGTARTIMSALLDLVNSRPARSIDDSIEGRTERDIGSRPDSACVVVNGREGLVLDRNEGNVSIPNVSGTSLTQEDIDGMTMTDPALELLYRTRQEIFIAEGMRLVDMGVKFVISETEQLQNDNVSQGTVGTEAQIPSFIADVADQLDAITFDKGTCTATTVINLNEILVFNKDDKAVLPFN